MYVDPAVLSLDNLTILTTGYSRSSSHRLMEFLFEFIYFEEDSMFQFSKYGILHLITESATMIPPKLVYFNCR